MAIIADQVPSPHDDFAKSPPRVVVKFRFELDASEIRTLERRLAEPQRSDWMRLKERYPHMRLEPYFSSLENRESEALKKRYGRRDESPLGRYFAIECNDVESAADTVSRLSQWPDIEVAYVEAGPVPPPLIPSDDPRSGNQGYLDHAPVGIDARWAWLHADGAGVDFIDLEQGWTLDHEDLKAANISIVSGLSSRFHGHGTAVLGEVVAFDNATGGIGIAPRVRTHVVSQWRTATRYNTAEAVLSAASALLSGDVLLIEAQTSHPTASGYVPVEVEPATFDAIKFATGLGIVVVEAGANGSIDLDLFKDVSGRRVLNRQSADFRDSGAIVVGAASSAHPHARLGFSNFGSRIDCFAWGQNIDTCGDGWVGTDIAGNTTAFGGTSGASPIVAGAALLLQSFRVGAALEKYSPLQLRHLLTNPALNTKSANPNIDRIGVMPNLRAILEHETGFA